MSRAKQFTPRKTSHPGRFLVPGKVLGEAIRGLIAGGGGGIACCCASSCLWGALLAWQDWNAFARPYMAILVTSCYIGALSVPIAILLAFPFGLVAGASLAFIASYGRRRQTLLLVTITITFGILETWIHTTCCVGDTPPVIPGYWFQHLATLLGTGWALNYDLPTGMPPLKPR